MTTTWRLVLSDGGTELPLRPDVAEALALSGGPALKSLALSIGLRPALDRTRARPEPFLRSGNVVGSSSVRHQSLTVEVVVTPKIASANVLQMLTTVEDLTPEAGPTVGLLERGGQSLDSLLIQAAQQLRQFTGRTRFRSYTRRSDRSRQPRGRIDAQRAMRHAWPRMDWSTVPCSYFELSPDVPENAILAGTIAVVGRLTALLPPLQRATTRRHLSVARRNLVGVSRPRDTLSLIESLSYNRTNRHFEPIHRLCAAVLRASNLFVHASGDVPHRSFAVDMAHLFERYVREVIRRGLGCSSFPPKRTLVRPIRNTNHRIELDGLQLSPIRRVVECKYRLVQAPDGGGFDEARVLNSHLFQAVAYALHDSVRAEEALIFYPSDNPTAPLVEALRTHSFLGPQGTALPVRVLLISLAHPVSSVVESLRALLAQEHRSTG